MDELLLTTERVFYGLGEVVETRKVYIVIPEPVSSRSVW